MPDYTEQPRAASGTPKGNARPKVRERGRWGPQVSLVEVYGQYASIMQRGRGRPSSRRQGAVKPSSHTRTRIHPTRGSKVPDSLDSRPHLTNVIAFIIATMGSDAAVPQFLTAVADALENISVPVLTLGTFTLGIFLHFIFGLLSKLSGSTKKKRKKGLAKKVN